MNFLHNGLSVHFTLGDYHQKARILNDVICLVLNPANRYLCGGKTHGLHQQHAVVGPMITIMDFSVTLTVIPMTAVGSSGTVGTGWDGVFLSWIPYKSSGGGHFGGTPVGLKHDVSRTTYPVVRVNVRHFCSGLTIRLSKHLKEPKIIPLETQS
jgi:hypothetical protein